MKIAIIGSNGFIGKYLTQSFLSDGNTALTNLDLAPKQTFLNPSQTCEYTAGSYRDKTLLKNVLNSVDCVYFLPSATYPSLSWKEPKLDITENLLPFVEFLDLCVEQKVKKVVLSSSGGTVYGDAQGTLLESDAAFPYSPYGIIKNTMENYLRFYNKKHSLQFDVYRVTNPYGPYQENYKQGFGVIYIWLQKIRAGEPIEIYGSGLVSRDFVYIDDVVQLMKHSVSVIDTSDVYNLSYGSSFSLIELAATMEKVIGKKLDIRFLEGRDHDSKRVQLSSKKLLEFFPQFQYTSLEDGIARTWQEISATSPTRTD